MNPLQQSAYHLFTGTIEGDREPSSHYGSHGGFRDRGPSPPYGPHGESYHPGKIPGRSRFDLSSRYPTDQDLAGRSPYDHPLDYIPERDYPPRPSYAAPRESYAAPRESFAADRDVSHRREYDLDGSDFPGERGRIPSHRHPMDPMTMAGRDEPLHKLLGYKPEDFQRYGKSGGGSYSRDDSRERYSGWPEKEAYHRAFWRYSEEEDGEERSYKRKRDSSPTKEFFCKVCQVTCTSDTDLQNHLKGYKHNKAKGAYSEDNFCKVCKILFNGSYEQHSRSTSHIANAQTCDQCFEVFDFRRDYERHHCPARANEIIAAETKERKSKKALPKEYYCKECQITCNSYLTMQTHIKGKNHMQLLERKKVEKHENYCSTCQQVYYGVYELHARTKGHKKCARTCSICWLVFEFLDEYEEHVAKHTGGSEPAQKGGILTAPVVENLESVPNEEPQMTDMVDEVSGLYCRLCLVFFRGDLITKLTHCSSQLHLQKCKEMKDPNYKEEGAPMADSTKETSQNGSDQAQMKTEDDPNKESTKETSEVAAEKEAVEGEATPAENNDDKMEATESAH